MGCLYQLTSLLTSYQPGKEVGRPAYFPVEEVIQTLNEITESQKVNTFVNL